MRLTISKTDCPSDSRCRVLIDGIAGHLSERKPPRGPVILRNVAVTRELLHCPSAVWTAERVISVFRETHKVSSSFASFNAKASESAIMPEPCICSSFSVLQYLVIYASLFESMAFIVRMARSRVYFDRRKWIVNDFWLMSFLTLVVSNDVHNLCDDSSRRFHAFVTARQTLRPN